jgi:Tol biopolymer transport system component
LKRFAPLVGIALLLGCGGDSATPTAPPTPSHLPIYKIAASFYDHEKIVVFQNGASPVTVGSDSALAEPVWSPDGNALAFGETHRMGTSSAVYSLHVWTLAGGIGPALASNPVQTGCGHLECFTFYARFDAGWSPDGKTLAFKAGSSAVGIINADGTGARTIPVNAIDIGTLKWSPDGQTISFINAKSSISSDLQGVLSAAPFSQKTLATLFQRIEGYEWSPDGKAIAATGGDHLGLYAIGSSTPSSTIDLSEVEFPSWSPDGSRVAFSSRIGDFSGGKDLFVVNKDGSGLRRVTHAADFLWQLAWTPDGRDLIFGVILGIHSADVEGGATLNLISGAVEMSVSRK